MLFGAILSARCAHAAKSFDSEELLQGAENGRYKVVAKAEPYKNLPVSLILVL